MKIVLQHLAPTDQLNRPKLSLSCQLGATGSILIRYLSTHPSLHSKTLKLKIDLTWPSLVQAYFISDLNPNFKLSLC